jgi:spermidine/putrescine transport system substrate-binding protein
MTDRAPEPMLEFLKSAMSRRGFLQTSAVGGALAGTGLLAACSTGPAATPAPSDQLATDMSDTEKIVNFSNWQLYIDVNAKVTTDHPTLDAFKAQSGIAVTYTEDIADNESFYAKIAPLLRNGQDTGRDLMALTDWMASRLIRQGFVEKRDKANTPNVDANLIAALKSPSWDPTRDHSAPWQSGVTGVAYNSKLVPEVKTITELLTRPDLKGRIAVLTEMRDTIGLIMLDQGKDPAKFTDDDFNSAIAVLQSAVDSKQIRKFTGNEYSQGLSKGDLAACMAWSGDVVQLQADNSNLKFVSPPSGIMIWADNMMIPNKARHKKNAEKLMNYYYDPAVAAQVAASVQYICPVQGAQQEMAKINPALVNNPLIFPTSDFLKNTHLFMGLTTDQEARYNAAFNKVRGA